MVVLQDGKLQTKTLTGAAKKSFYDMANLRMVCFCFVFRSIFFNFLFILGSY